VVFKLNRILTTQSNKSTIKIHTKYLLGNSINTRITKKVLLRKRLT
jgi:hypothetical protein